MKNVKTQVIVNQPYIIHILEDRKCRRKFRGIAKCQPEDIWSEERGKGIAKLKSENKRDLWKYRRLVSQLPSD